MTIHGVNIPSDSYLSMQSALSGISNSPLGTLSFWYRSMEVPTRNQYGNQYNLYLSLLVGLTATNGRTLFSYVGPMFQNVALSISLQSGTTNSPADRMEMMPSRIWIDDGYWHHVIMSWNTNHAPGAREFKAIVDGIDSYYTINTDTGASFAPSYTSCTKWTIGDSLGGGNIAELWFAPGVQLDLSNPANIAKFMSNGAPVSLGTNGSTPTGSPPVLYLSCQSATASDFLTNLGTGGGSFTAAPNPLSLSDRDPHVEIPYRFITGTTANLTMHQASFTGLNIDINKSSSSRGQSNIFLNASGPTDPTVQLDLQFSQSDNVTPVTASFAILHDDGKTFDTDSITPPVAGSPNSQDDFVVCRGTSAVFVSLIDYVAPIYNPVLVMDIMPLTTDITPNTPVAFTSSAWMDDQMQNDGYVQQGSSCIWWNGKEQCIGLVDTSPNGGHVAMVDVNGNPTDAKVWGGYSPWGSMESSFNGAYLLTIPDSANNKNYFFTAKSNGNAIDSQTYAVTADATTGVETSRAVVYCDNLIVEQLIRWSLVPSYPLLQPIQIVTTPNGWVILGSSSPWITNYMLVINPQFTSYTLYTLVADPSDDLVRAILDTRVGYGSALYSGINNWMYSVSGAFMEIEFYSKVPNVLLQDYVPATSDVIRLPGDKFTQIDTTTNGICLASGPRWYVQNSGSTSYFAPSTPLMPDYTIMFGIDSSGGGTTIADDGNELYVIGRADNLANGYKVGIKVLSGHYHLRFQVMPSGSVIDIDMGTMANQYGATIYFTMEGSSITVAVVAFGGWLLPDGTWQSTGGQPFSWPVDVATAVNAVSITDTTYAGPGRIVLGGVKP